MDNAIKTPVTNTASTVMPLHTHWDSRQLADAVPLPIPLAKPLSQPSR